MKIKELRSQKIKGLQTTLKKLTAEGQKIRMELGIGKLKNNQKLRYLKRDMARIRTILNEQVIIEAEDGKTE